MVANPLVPIIAVVLYGVFIVTGRSYFKDRPAWNWRTSLALWNLGLSVFSAIGFCRVFPQLVHDFYYYSVTENFCFDPENFYGSGATGLWVQLFVLSKFPYVMTEMVERSEIQVGIQLTYIYNILHLAVNCSTRSLLSFTRSH